MPTSRPDLHPPIPTVPGVLVTRPRDGVTLLTLNRPDRYNALDPPILLGLPGLLDRLADDPSTRALVLCGAGPAFCAGGDLDLIRSSRQETAERNENFLVRILGTAASLHRLPQPTIAAVNGPVAGAGLGLALACDIRIAAPTATFSAPFIHMALVPDMGITWFLPRLIGSGAALELLLSGRQVEADEARALGLVSRICDEPVESALALAANFAAMPPGAVATTKAMVRQALNGDLDTAILAEARQQAVAVHGPEYANCYPQWRTSVTGGAP